MQSKLSFNALGALDGGMVGGMIDHHLSEAVRDCEDRGPRDGKPRKVLIEITISSVNEGQMSVGVKCHNKLPPMVTADTVANVRYEQQKPALFFEALSPEDPDQQTLPGVDGGDQAAE